MTPLKALILSLLSTHGPLRDVDLLCRTPERSLTTVTLACFSLQDAGLIEIPRGTRPVSFHWQLTPQGRQWIAGNQQQEVCLGSI